MGQPLADADARRYQASSPPAPRCSTRSPPARRATTWSSARAPAARPRSTSDRRPVNMGVARAAERPCSGRRHRPWRRLRLALRHPGAAGARRPGARGRLVINKFRGDLDPPAPRGSTLHALHRRPCSGCCRGSRGLAGRRGLPALEAPRPGGRRPRRRRRSSRRRPAARMSNFTDFDALAAEAGVGFASRAPGRRSSAPTWCSSPGRRDRRRSGAAARAAASTRPSLRRPAAGDPILGVCGGYQMMGGRSRTRWRAAADGGRASVCCPSARASPPEKRLRRVAGTVALAGGAPATGYEIRHGEPSRSGGEAMIDDGTAEGEGCALGAVFGTYWHGLLEGDEVRRGLLAWVAARRGRRWVAGTEPSPRSASATSTASVSLSRSTWTWRRWRR